MHHGRRRATLSPLKMHKQIIASEKHTAMPAFYTIALHHWRRRVTQQPILLNLNMATGRE
jgi:hypothetical protein